MADLPQVDFDAFSQLQGLASSAALKASLAEVMKCDGLWREVDAGELTRTVLRLWPEPASALLSLTRGIIAESGQGEALFLGGTEPVAGDVLAPAVVQWSVIQQGLYEDALTPLIGVEVGLQFVERFRTNLNDILHLAVPRLKYWKSRESG